MYVRSSCRGGASAYANSLPNPLISGSQNAGALNDYRITGFTGGWRGPSPTLPRRSSLPFLGSREPSLSYSNVLPFTLLPDLSFSLIFHIRSSSLFSLFALKFVPHPPPSVRPLIPNVRTPAYTSLLLTTTLYY